MSEKMSTERPLRHRDEHCSSAYWLTCAGGWRSPVAAGYRCGVVAGASDPPYGKYETSANSPEMNLTYRRPALADDIRPYGGAV